MSSHSSPKVQLTFGLVFCIRYIGIMSIAIGSNLSGTGTSAIAFDKLRIGVDTSNNANIAITQIVVENE